MSAWVWVEITIIVVVAPGLVRYRKRPAPTWWLCAWLVVVMFDMSWWHRLELATVAIVFWAEGFNWGRIEGINALATEIRKMWPFTQQRRQ